MTFALSWIADSWAEAIRSKPPLNIWQFAAKHIVFDAKMGNITGPWDEKLTPYTKLFQEAITNDFTDIPEGDWFLRSVLEKGQRIDECFVLKSSQSGFTQAALNGVIYIPLFDPGRLLYAMPSREKAKNVARLRVIPFLRQLAGHIIANEDDVNLTLIELVNMIAEFGGSGSSAFFSEKALRYGFLDDVEYMVNEGGVAGMLDGVHIIDHIRSRFTTADESFLGVFSKPDLQSSELVSNWRSGSMHSWVVRCPHCGGRQVLEPEGLYYDKKQCRDLAGRYDLEAVEELTTYRCAVNGCDIAEGSKYEMNSNGIWLPKSREDRAREEDPPLTPRRLSMRISDLNSPFPKVKWGILARMKIEAENNPAKLKHVMTNHFARPWRVKAINIKADHVRAVCAGARDPKTGKYFPNDVDGDGRLKMPAYDRGTVPFIPLFLSATSDVQGDKYKWTVCAWRFDGTCALVEYGACLSSAELFEMMLDPRTAEGAPLVCLANPNQSLVIDHGLIDSGHDTFGIYDFCVRTNWVWYPSKGVGQLGMTGRMVEARNDTYQGVPVIRYHYNDYMTKVNLAHKISRAHDSKATSPRLFFPRNIGDDLVIELLSESLQPSKRSGYKRMEWIHDKKIGPNDWWDALKMQFVIWQIVGPKLQMDHGKPAAETPPTLPAKTLAQILEELRAMSPEEKQRIANGLDP